MTVHVEWDEATGEHAITGLTGEEMQEVTYSLLMEATSSPRPVAGRLSQRLMNPEAWREPMNGMEVGARYWFCTGCGKTLITSSTDTREGSLRVRTPECVAAHCEGSAHDHSTSMTLIRKAAYDALQ